MVKRYILLILALGAFTAWGQKPHVKESVVRISARYLCSSYNVDGRIFDSDESLTAILDSLQKVQPDSYPIMGQWCRVQRMRINRMKNSLEEYQRDGELIWLDSTHCVIDAPAFITQLGEMATLLQTKSDEFEQLEKNRIEAERKAAEERARAEALRIQREKDSQLALIKDTIRNLHRSVTTICDARGESDKIRVKELKEIYYAYLSVYNRYDLTDVTTTDLHFKQLTELCQFQHHLLDSVLGPNSYAERMEEFKNTLHLHAGKDHADVNKSYLRVFKKIQIPINFKSIAEYNSYVSQLRELMAVQQSYLEVIRLRDTISKNSTTLALQCSKGHKEILNSYKEILSEQNTVPAYATLVSANKFIDNLNDFIEIQHLYSGAIVRMETIDKRGDSIVSLCTKNISDIGNAYKELRTNTDLVPRFINRASAERYHEILDQFEELQSLYVTVIDIRKKIDKRGVTITSNKNAPHGLIAGYKQMVAYTDFTPRFTTARGGNDFIKTLNHFIELQEKFVEVSSRNSTIVNNTRQFKTAFKDYHNIYKAYERLMKSYDYELNIINEADINSYLKHQEMVLAMQKRFLVLANSLEKEDYDNRLKRVRDPEKIKLIMGVN